MSSTDCRLLCAAGAAYGIDATTGKFTQQQPEYDGAQFDPKAPPKVYASTGEHIDAALVGVTTDGIVVAFRGTIPNVDTPSGFEDWIQDLLFEPEKVDGLPGEVHPGFYKAVTEIYQDVANEVSTLAAANPSAKLYVTGHSKGGPMASIFAIKWSRESGSSLVPNVVTFASARPGTEAFATQYDAEISQVSYENYLDLVPFLPPSAELWDLLAKLPIIGGIFKGAESWNYWSVGDRKYIQANGQVVDVYPGLDTIRLGEIALDMVDGNYMKIGQAHCHGCAASDCAGGYMKGVCEGSICGG